MIGANVVSRSASNKRPTDGGGGYEQTTLFDAGNNSRFNERLISSFGGRQKKHGLCFHHNANPAEWRSHEIAASSLGGGIQIKFYDGCFSASPHRDMRFQIP